MSSPKLLRSLSHVLLPRGYAASSYCRVKYLRKYSDGRELQQESTKFDNEIKDANLDPLAQANEKHVLFIDSINPPLKRSFNLASYVNSCKTLQELVKVGVSLYDIENLKPDAAKHLVQLDFEHDCVKYIKFLLDIGLKTSNLGRFISEFPEIFQLPIIELQSRLEYLNKNGFDLSQIRAAVNRSSYILARPIKTLDFKISHFQIEFNMPAQRMRKVLVKHPAVLAHPIMQFKLVNFCITEEFGFSLRQIHSILDQQPKTVDILRNSLFKRLDMLHNDMKLSHNTIAKFPKLITGPDIDISQRFKYLQKLRRDQFNPRLPLYVQPSSLYNGSDEHFCERYAKTSLDDYKLFVKSCL